MELLATRLVASKRLYVNGQDTIVINPAIRHFENCSLCCHSSSRKTQDLGLELSDKTARGQAAPFWFQLRNSFI